MAALLVALAVMAVMMSVALPVWRHEAQRQKEDELIWRGNQYVRGIRLYAAKNGGILPPSVDALVSGHFIRKKYKDPVTNDDFDYLGAGATTPGLAPGQGQALPGQPGQPQSSTTSPNGQPGPTSTIASSGVVPGGLSGVRSKSKDESIKVYQGRTHYNEWTFIYVSQNPGLGVPGRGQPGAIGPNGQPLGPGRGRGVGPDGKPLPFPPGGGPGRGGPTGPGRFGPGGPGGSPSGPGGPGGSPTFPPGFPPNPGRRGGGGL
jgi:type II secretory pathway pseudopilin PulG